jgi:hypothetical protein
MERATPRYQRILSQKVIIAVVVLDPAEQCRGGCAL